MLLGAVLLWALNLTVTKYMLEHGWLPLAYATIRYFAAISIFWAYTWWRERSFRIARADWRYVGIAAAMIFLNQLCFVYALEFAHAGFCLRRDIDADIFRQRDSFDLGFFVQNRHFGFQIGRLDVGHEPPLEP